MPTPAERAASFAKAWPGALASIMPIGARSAQVVLVAESGPWVRVVVTSVDAGQALCDRLGVAWKPGWPEDLHRRITAGRRTPREWASAPYPERG